MLRTHKKHPVTRRFFCLYLRYGNSKSQRAKYDLKVTSEVSGIERLGFVDVD